jgi:hypothetical protein
MERILAVFCGITLVLLLFFEGAGLILGEPSVRDISTPCRDHGGVAQYVPVQHAPWQWEGAFVVCRDGKVGEVS